MDKIRFTHRRARFKLRKWSYLASAHPALHALVKFRRSSTGNRTVRIGLIVLGVVLIGAVLGQFYEPVKALSKALAGADLLEGKTQYGEVRLSNNKTTLELQKGSVGSWDTDSATGMQLVPSLTYGSRSMDYGPNNNIYYIANFGNICQFLSYDIELKEWLALNSPPIGCSAGMNLVYDGAGSLYYTPGGNKSYLFRYDIATDSWTRLADVPAQIGSLSKADFVNRNGVKSLYVFRGAGSASLWKYDVASNQWANMAPFPTTSSVANGIAMTWDGADTIYALTNHVGEFKKYSIATGLWTDIGNYSAYSDLRSSLVFANGSVIATGVRITANQTTLSVYNVAADTWSSVPTPAPAMTLDWIPSASFDGSRYLYAQIGSDNRPEMYRYDTVNRTWNERSLFTGQGNDDWHFPVAYDGSQTLYYTASIESNIFSSIYKYSLVSGIAEQVGSQFNTTAGWKGAFHNGSVYFLSNQTTSFARFNTATNTMSELAPAPFVSSWGADILDGGDGYLYVAFGCRTNFSRYHVATNTWETRASLINRNICHGGGMTRIGRTIYLLHGDASGYFSRYNMDTNSWTDVGPLPTGGVDYGGFITGDGFRYLYLGLGTRTPDHNRRVWRFDTTTSAWQRIADLPESTNLAANGFYDTVNNKLYVSQGWSSNKLWSWSPSNANYVQKGTWYSKEYDLQQVQSWGALESTIGGGGSATIYTRTSPTGRVWSDWQPVTGTTINSPVNRYAQLKVQLSGDGTTTPTVSGLKINYNQELSAPTLPAQFSAKSKEGGADLVSGTPYEWQHPYFSWLGASDGPNGAGVKGYHVYFGNDSGADPVTAGSFQTGSSYTVTEPMTAGEVYYVRIKVEDKLGNISNAATFFSYRYFYISPPGTVIKTSNEDFNAGENVNVSIANGALGLNHSPHGAWSLGGSAAFPDKVRSSASVVIGDHLYSLQGRTTTTFWRYNLISQNWENLAPMLATVVDGSSMTWDGDNYIYATRGNGSNGLYRYSIQDNLWETLPVLPAIAQHGSDITYIGDGKIAMLFSGVREFYLYHIASQTFVVADSYPNQISYAGSGIWYDGDDAIYANLGSGHWGGTADNTRPILAKYSLSTNSWRELGQPPLASVFTQNNLVGDGRGNLYMTTSNVYNNLDRKQQMMKYSIQTGLWSEVHGLPAQVSYGSMTTDNKRYVYIMPSQVGGSSMLIRYDTWDNKFTPGNPHIDKWERIASDWPTNGRAWSSNSATTAVYDGSKYIYAIGFSEQSFSYFIRFDPATGETLYLPPAFYISIGGSLTMINGELYYVRAGISPQVFRFDMVDQYWERMTDVPINVWRPGPSNFVSVGSTGYLVGNSTYMYQYTPGVGGGTWTRRADIPGAVQNGSAVYDSENGYIYVLRGNATSSFYRYSIATNSWATLSSLPATTSYGSAMVLSEGKIYAIRGNYIRDTYVYDIASNNWTSGVNAPDSASYGSAIVKVDEKRAFWLPGSSSSDIWQFNFSSSDRAYQGFAQHTSQPISVAGMFDYADISAKVTLPENTKVEFWTRSSVDGNTWDEWEITDQAKYVAGRMSLRVNSKAQKFTQIKVMLYSHDNIYTPIVEDYKLNYYSDVDPPSNPTTVDVFSDSSKQTQISSNTWYSHSKPTFDWPDPGQAGGATDGPLGSNMRGYWVYFGPDETAMPRTAGVFVSGTDFTANLTSSGTYFFRIQTEDMTGNVDPVVYSPFAYKFDNTPPTTPSMITAIPGGYTTTNNYSFDWPAAFDGDSGVASYCYYTGATSGPFATEICQAERELKDISAAYRTGTNVFYLRTKDTAGNYSAAYTTVSYYYSTDPPSPPTNLRAIPPTSTENLFAFAWDLPALYAGDPSQLRYCYSVNELPASHNTTCTSERFISPFKAATQQGTNVLYMVTMDEAGNVNWTNYSAANFIANTVSPGIPLNLAVIDTSDQSAGRWSLTTTWSKPTFEGNGVSHYIVQRSLNGHSFENLGNTSTTAFVDLTVDPNVTYYYRVKASDSVGNSGGASGTMSGTPRGNYSTPPAIVVAPSVSAESNQAEVAWATSRESTSFVYFGTSPTDLSQSKGSLTPVTEHTQTITGLLPSTTYYYRVQSFDNERSYEMDDSLSQIFSFKTAEAAQVYNVATDSTTLNSTIVSWQTSVPTRATIEYGPDSSYASQATDESGSYSTNHIFRLSGLMSGTTYHFRIVSKTQFGSTLYSDDYTFTTQARPSISNVRFQPLTDKVSTAVRVTWNTNVPTTSTLRYRGSEDSREVSSSQMTTQHSIEVLDLASSTEYIFSAEGRDQYGNLVTSEEQHWKSTFDTRAPSVSKLNVSMTTTQGSNKTRAQLIISWKTDEPATSQVSYDLGASKQDSLKKQSPLNAEPTTSHVVVISNLELAEIYKIQVVSRDLNGNTTYGKLTSVVTPDRELNVLDSVLTILERVFRF